MFYNAATLSCKIVINIFACFQSNRLVSGLTSNIFVGSHVHVASISVLVNTPTAKVYSNVAAIFRNFELHRLLHCSKP
jgi:hypothetical protein